MDPRWQNNPVLKVAKEHLEPEQSCWFAERGMETKMNIKNKNRKIQIPACWINQVSHNYISHTYLLHVLFRFTFVVCSWWTAIVLCLSFIWFTLLKQQTVNGTANMKQCALYACTLCTYCLCCYFIWSNIYYSTLNKVILHISICSTCTYILSVLFLVLFCLNILPYVQCQHFMKLLLYFMNEGLISFSDNRSMRFFTKKLDFSLICYRTTGHSPWRSLASLGMFWQTLISF